MAQPNEQSIGRWLARALGVFAAVWLACFAVYLALPNLRAGAGLVFETKARMIESQSLFPAGAPVRVAMFGDSKTMSGFIPREFDEMNGGRTASYNVGLPNWREFVDNVDVLCRRGQAPTHALLQFPWSDRPEESHSWAHYAFHPPIEDKTWMTSVFPFRTLPRDAALFLGRAGSRGGLVAYYRFAGRQVGMMVEARGYYFIEGQSHYPGHQLPDDFRLETDKPGTVRPREARLDVPEFARLVKLADQYGMTVYLVPAYVRQGEAAPPPAVNEELVRALAPYKRIRVLGPDYDCMPNRLFSDHAHLNPEGAKAYTRRLYELLRGEFESTPATGPN